MLKPLLFIAVILCLLSCKKKDCFSPLVIHDLIFTDSELIPVINETNKGGLILQSLDDGLNPIDEFQPEWFSFFDEDLGLDVYCMKLSGLAYESAGRSENSFLLLWPGGRTDTLLLDIQYEKKGDCISYINVEHSINAEVLGVHPDYMEFYYFDVTD